ncbi:hypothetical protein [Methanobacterium alcaliphilum]|uniref:hypothetical protein n=1 Tax=Methanobacterium alcaliphilum TaxID=392018 RepID=UPI002009F379|nr:hypothetical protein [Methanobacterium alcaliphilum]MCK9151204.1 hypothetical protein [Methanobacterium alcaliphilum]
MLKLKDVIELQEKLIIIYKYISQKRQLALFYYSGMEDQIPSKDLNSNPFVKKVVEMDHAEDILKECILELEDMLPLKFKEDYDPEVFDNEFQYILFKNSLEALGMKYKMKDCDEIEKLDISSLVELIGL